MNITKLKENEIIIVGTNQNGYHYGGAAKQAFDDFGLKWGVGEGLSGSTYAFPTLGKKMNQRTDRALKRSINKLYEVAKSMPDKKFLLTAVGTGIAGFSVDYMKSLFKNALENIINCEEFF